MQLNFASIDIKRLCKSSLQFVTPQANQKNIELLVNVPFNLPDLRADEKRLRQILVNLLNNAVKFTDDNGTVTLTIDRPDPVESNSDERIRFSVTDTGIGVEAQKLKDLFEPFVQVETVLNRDHGGTGLGLSLVKQFSKLHGGSVGATSEPGVGSCFYVDLPLRQESTSANSNGTESTSDEKIRHSQQRPPPPKLKKENPSAFILLAEDNDAIAKSLTRHLEYLNFHVHRVQDGEAALEAAYTHEPDIILMDIQMPTVDGLEVIRRLRADLSFNATPIIATTGLAMEGDGNRCIAAGANHYLSKPYMMQELLDLVEQSLNLETV